ncbi:MAG TPA: HEAT repeat domain-containing protein [Eubacteriales bacterium]|nr:HEAT repeat domain-containing protein [Eubacteriales bacterium]
MVIVQSVVNWLIIIMAGFLVLFTLLLLALHFTSAAHGRRIQKMREQLLCLISEEASAERIRSKLYDMVDPEGETDSISDIAGIRSLRGLQVISETADELGEAEKQALAREVGGEWYGKFLKKQFAGGGVDAIILVIKLVGTLDLRQYVPDVITQIYCYRATTQMQHIGMLSLCLLGAEKELVAICRDSTVASLLSFRTLEELFATYTGDREKLCRVLINTAADQYIRRTCIKTIGERGYADLAGMVEPYLESDQVNARIDAIRTFGQLKYAPALERIRAFAADGRWEIRVAVATALGRYGAEENFEPLIGLLCDREWWVRYRAAESLAEYPDEKALLARVEETGDRYAREMMRFALDKRALAAGEAA